MVKVRIEITNSDTEIGGEFVSEIVNPNQFSNVSADDLLETIKYAMLGLGYVAKTVDKIQFVDDSDEV